MPNTRILILTVLALAIAINSFPLRSLQAQASQTELDEIISIDRNSVKLRRLSILEEKTVELKGLTIQDEKLANEVSQNYLQPNTNLRVLFLMNGSSYIRDYSLVGPAEKSAQDQAAAKRLGIWQSIATLEQHGYNKIAESARSQEEQKRLRDNLITASQKWILQYWPLVLAILSVILGTIPLIYRRRHFEVIVMGARGVGKTVFFRRINDDASLIKEVESTRGEVKERIRLKSRNGRSVFHMQLLEVGGQYPGLLFERLAKRHLLPRNRRVVLVFVLSPFSTGSNKQPSEKVDHGFVERQLGWIESLVRGFIESPRGKKRCQGLLFFVNMFDLFSSNRDDAAKKSEYATLFERHLNSARTSRKDVQLMIGSAQNLWLTAEAKAWIFRTVAGEINL